MVFMRWIHFTGIVFFLFLLSFCGAPHPFKRGEPSPPVSNQNNSGTQNVTSGKTVFLSKIYPKMVDNCMVCHKGMGPPFNLVQDPETDYVTVLTKIVPGNIQASIIYKKVQSDTQHDGGKVWDTGSLELSNLKEWIESEK